MNNAQTNVARNWRYLLIRRYALIKGIVPRGVRVALTCFLAALAFLGALTLTAIVAFALFAIFLRVVQTLNLTQSYDQFISWCRSLIARLFPWPITVLAVVALLGLSRTASIRIGRVIGRFKRVKVAGTEVELSEENRREIQDAADEIVQMAKDYRGRINREIDRRVQRYDLLGRVDNIVTHVLRNICNNDKMPDGFRCTIHILDPMLQEHLYQLMRYYPKGEGFGRSFSERYGIIGKVWRTGNAEVEGRLVSEKDEGKSEAEKLRIIARNWGMSFEEARHALERPSYVCVPIKQDEARLGVFYMDSKDIDAFLKDEVAVARQLEEAFAHVALPNIVNRIIKDIDPVAPRINLNGDN